MAKGTLCGNPLLLVACSGKTVHCGEKLRFALIGKNLAVYNFNQWLDKISHRRASITAQICGELLMEKIGQLVMLAFLLNEGGDRQSFALGNRCFLRQRKLLQYCLMTTKCVANTRSTTVESPPNDTGGERKYSQVESGVRQSSNTPQHRQSTTLRRGE